MVEQQSYVPDRGDLVWVSFNPQKGREQANKRPAVVLSPKTYNIKSSLALMCPITSQIKRYPFEVELITPAISGAVLADHVRSLDWRARKVSFIQKLPANMVQRVQEKTIALITE
jgi:mRNA interferase MazF